ncbi:MAG: maleylpyruvate isomerase N-terminal domain-containing protein, partial [Actinomycetota bacterium]
VDDLVWHLTHVQHFWASIVGDQLDGPEAIVWPERPSSTGLVPHFDEVSARLVAALTNADPEAPCWSWYEHDQRVGWVLRRQAHEALIHRVDADLALAAVGGSDVGPVDGALAADGIDEMLDIMLGAEPVPAWATWTLDGPTIRLVATTDLGPDRSWLASPGRLTGTDADGKDQDLAAIQVTDLGPAVGDADDADNADGADGAEASAVVRGPAAELDLWLWRRGQLADAVVTGDRALAERLPNLGDD